MKYLYRTLFLLILLMTITPSKGQNQMHIWQNDQLIKSYSLSGIDSISFELPEGYIDPAKNIFIKDGEIGKNYFYYSVIPSPNQKPYSHGAMMTSFYNYVLNEYFGLEPNTESNEVRTSIYSTFESFFAEKSTGAATFLRKDYEYNLNESKLYEVIAGQPYQVFAMHYEGETVLPAYDVAVRTSNPAVSSENISLENIEIDIESVGAQVSASENILYAYTLYGQKEKVNSLIEAQGLDHLMFLYGQRMEKDEFSVMTRWPMPDNQTYTLYLIGVDREGDQILINQDFERTMVTPDKQFLVIDSYTVTEEDVTLTIQAGAIEDVSQSVVAKFSRWSDVWDQTNQGVSLGDIALNATNKIDVTASVKETGYGTASFNNIPNSWNPIIIFVSYNDGNTLARYYEYWPETGEDLWEDFPYTPSVQSRQRKKATDIFLKRQTTKNQLTNKEILDRIFNK